MEFAWKMTAVCLLAAVLTGILKKRNPEFAILLAAAACLFVLAAAAERFSDVIQFLARIQQSSLFPMELFSPLLKTIGIAWISNVGADLCRDAGQSAMATTVEMAGVLAAILAAMPLFEKIWDLLQGLL